MRLQLLAGTLVMGAALLAGCGGGGRYYAGYAPPAPRSYVAIGRAPGPGYVWTNGYWDWRGRNWGWVEGRWMRPPRQRAVWVAPEWRHEGRGYKFHRGHWR